MSFIRDKASHPNFTRKLTANLFLLLSSVYILTSSGNTVDVTDDGIVRYAVAQSLAERGSFDLPSDIGARFGIKGRGAHYYTNHGLGQSLLVIPFLLLGNYLGNAKFLVSLLGPLACALACVVLFSFCLRLGYSPKTAVSLSLIAGLCTQIWPESKSPFDHSIETLFSLLSAYLVYAYFQDGKRTRLLMAGACLGFAVLTRITVVFWLLALAVFVYSSSPREKSHSRRIQCFLRNSTHFLFGFVPFLVFIFWYNAFRFGSILEAGYTQWARERGVDNFSNPLWIGLCGELFSPGKGVFFYCPILLLPLLGLKRFIHWRTRVATVCIIALTFYLLFFAKYVAWHGDIAWGPRYLTFLMPFWILFFGMFWEGEDFIKSRYFRVIAKILVVVSFSIQLGAVMIDMNVHYFRLLKLGVIKNVESYSYPAELYFQWQYSPLIDRFREIKQALRISEAPVLAMQTLGREREEMIAVIDFWWIHNLSNGVSKPAILLLVGPFVLEIVLSSLRIRKLLRQGFES